MSLLPINYSIHLEPDLVNFRFSGRVDVLIEAQTPIDEIEMNILEIAIWSCDVQFDDNFVACPFSVDSQTETMHITLPEKMAGEILLRIDYDGKINDKMAGFYRSQYQTEETEKYIAVTQFQERDARRAFPCFDTPEKKATFDIEMVVDEGLVALSNQTISEENVSSQGIKRVKFLQTPKMSTYLLFFGVGEFDTIEDKEDIRVRAQTMPGLTAYAEFGLEFGRKSLRACEEYYEVPYPLSKLDLIAIPDFAFGAMENWGAITFRENLLLHYPESTSKAGKERICEVIAHEMVHQWFGNLVTPSDWKYLWLNESFATHFSYSILARYYPEWGVWDRFLHSQTNPAMVRDALYETFPIEIPGKALIAINTSTAPIIYNKGGSILRQIEGYIGEKKYRDGLKHYLKRHEYGCASSHDLWEALEMVAELPIVPLMKSWIEQPGFPLVRVKQDGKKLILTQHRFTYLSDHSEQEWQIPVGIKIFYDGGVSEDFITLFNTRTMEVDLGDGVLAYKLNYGQTGFYRVAYDDDWNLQKLGEFIRKKRLPAEDRWGIQNDLFALVQSGNMSLDIYLEYLSFYENEEAFLPLIGISDNLFYTFLVADYPARDKVASFGKSYCEKVLFHIGYEPVPDESHTTSILRDQIIWHAVLYGSHKTAEFAREMFAALRQGSIIDPDIVKSIMQVGAYTGGDDVFDWFDQEFRASDSEHRRMNILTAMGCFSNPVHIEKALQYVFDKVPERNKFIPILSLASNPHAMPEMWDWYMSNVQLLEKGHPIIYERIIAGIVPLSGLGKEKDIDAFFDDYIRVNNKFEDVVKMSLEQLEINRRMRMAM